MSTRLGTLVAALVGVTVLAAGCTQAAPAASPTAAPTAKPAATAAPAAPAAPTKAPAAAPTPSPAPARAEYPGKDRPITIIVGVSAGSTSDIAARLLADVLKQELGVPAVEVINKPGASTQVALTELAKSKPDGHTISFFNFDQSLPTYLDVERTKAVYSRKDLQAVAGYTADDTVLAVKGDSPYKTMKDLIDAAKARPGEIKLSDGSVMGTAHLAVLQLKKSLGLKVNSVHFDGAAPALTALLGGHVDAFLSGGGALGSHYKQGTVRILAMLDAKPSPFLPDVKTATEQGFNIVAASSQGVIVPAGTPPEAVAMLSAAVRKATENPDIKAKLNASMVHVKYMDTKEFEAFWTQREEVVKSLIPLAKEEGN